MTKSKIKVDKYLKNFYDPSLGGNLVFIGTVRNKTSNGDLIDYLYYECHKEMALTEIKKILEKYLSFKNFEKALVVHRIGKLNPKDIAILVALANKHRDNIFNTLDSIVKEIKEKVPIWKKEYFNNTSKWI
ncbi:MAG: molybdopterin synthase catalytic subunit [bacterium]